MPGKNYSANGTTVQELLTVVSQQAEQAHQFVHRRSKMNGTVFVQTMVLGCLQKAQMSLSELAQTSTRLGVPISAPGLDQRIDEEAVGMLQAVLQESIQRLAGQERLDIALLRRFSAVFLLDSTGMQLPAALSEAFPGSGGKASPAGLKIQVLFEFLHSTFRAMEVGAGNHSDQHCSLHVQHSQPGALHLFDLGYFNPQVLFELDRREAFFITRFDHQTALYRDEAGPQRLDLLPLLQLVEGDRLEVQVQLGRSTRLPVRALFQRLPPGVVQERRRKTIARMKEKGRTPSESYLALLEWVFFVTNIPADGLSFEQILLLYRVRWQVELVFKLWKSQAGLKCMGAWRKERLLVQLYARLIGLTLFYALAAPFRWVSAHELSFPKAFVTFQARMPTLIRTIRHGWQAFPALLKRLYAHWTHYDHKTQRCSHLSTLELLLQAAN